MTDNDDAFLEDYTVAWEEDGETYVRRFGKQATALLFFANKIEDYMCGKLTFLRLFTWEIMADKQTKRLTEACAFNAIKTI